MYASTSLASKAGAFWYVTNSWKTRTSAFCTRFLFNFCWTTIYYPADTKHPTTRGCTGGLTCVGLPTRGLCCRPLLGLIEDGLSGGGMFVLTSLPKPSFGGEHGPAIRSSS